MHEGDVKPVDEMSREELIAAATFWRAAYERVIAGSASYTTYSKCAASRDMTRHDYPLAQAEDR